MNQDVIAVDQDELGIEGFRYSSDGILEVWFKPLVDGEWAMCVLNRSPPATEGEVRLENRKFSDELSRREAGFDTTCTACTICGRKKEMGTTEDTLNAELSGHDVLMLRLQKQ